METRANHVWVGSVTLALLALLAGFAVWIARLEKGDQDLYDIYFQQSVDGLAKGSEVSYSGVPAGQVKLIELWPRDPSYVHVRVAIDHKIPVLRGTTATIQGSFTGVSTLLLTGGINGAPALTAPGPDGVPVIPTARSGLGALLSSAPVLMEKLSNVADHLADVLNDDNRAQLSGILANTNRITKGMADAAPQLKGMLTALQATLAQATLTLAEFQKTAILADRQLDPDAPGALHQLQATLASAKEAADALKTEVDAARPATQQLSRSTLPKAEAAMRDLAAAAAALRAVTEKVDDGGLGAVVGKSKLPDYKP